MTCMAKGSKGEDMFYQKMATSVDRRINNPIYCRICGQEVLFYSQDERLSRWEAANATHLKCYNNRMRKKEGGK